MTFRPNLTLAACALFALSLAGCSEAEPPAAVAHEPSREGEVGISEFNVLSNQMQQAANQPSEEGLQNALALTRHPDYLVRIQAIKALSSVSYRNSERGITALREAVNDEHWLVRSFAVKALGRGGDNADLALLQARLGIETHERVQRYLRESIERLQNAAVH